MGDELRERSSPGEETRAFVRELARDLTPVERIARLRTAALSVLAAWGALAAALLSAKGLSPSLSDGARLAGGFGAVLSGLALSGGGGLLAALALAVPGRVGAVRLGGAAGALGLLAALGLGGWLLAADPVARAAAPTLGSDAACLSVALVLALLPAAVALRYVARAAPLRPLPTLFGVGFGCVALGALAAQAGCADPALRHLLVSHAAAPVLGAALLLVPLRLGLRRLRGDEGRSFRGDGLC